MNILVIGANGSGKSIHAENLVTRLPPGKRYYIATMIPFGEDGRERVEKHRVQRADSGFITLERPSRVSEAELPPDAMALLEDVSNLLSNAIFENGGDEDSVFADITALCVKCHDCVMVTIGGLEAKPEYNEETLRYIGALNRLNQRLSDYADAVVEMRGGMPVCVKGNGHALD